MVTTDKAKLQQYMERFRIYACGGRYEQNPNLNFQSNPILSKEEGYKYRELASNVQKWRDCEFTPDDIGSGKIVRTLWSFAKSTNLVDTKHTFTVEEKLFSNLAVSDSIAYNIFNSTNDEYWFNEAAKVWKGRHSGRYDLISFAFFLKNGQKYLPLRSKTFQKDIFPRIGIEYEMIGKCQWENYQGFIRIVREIRDQLESYFEHEFSLIDAHSFLWMIAHQICEEDWDLPIINPSDGAEKIKDVLSQVKTRVGQAQYRNALIEYWEGKCSVTGCDALPLLRASHVKPWCECNKNNEQLDVYNGLLLIPNLDTLFDKGFITFEDNGMIRISGELSVKAQLTLGVSPDMSIRQDKMNDKLVEYLHYHQRHIFRGDN